MKARQTYWALIIVEIATSLRRLGFRAEIDLLVCFSMNTKALSSRQPETHAARGWV